MQVKSNKEHKLKKGVLEIKSKKRTKSKYIPVRFTPKLQKKLDRLVRLKGQEEKIETEEEFYDRTKCSCARKCMSIDDVRNDENLPLFINWVFKKDCPICKGKGWPVKSPVNYYPSQVLTHHDKEVHTPRGVMLESYYLILLHRVDVYDDPTWSCGSYLISTDGSLVWSNIMLYSEEELSKCQIQKEFPITQKRIG